MYIDEPKVTWAITGHVDHSYQEIRHKASPADVSDLILSEVTTHNLVASVKALGKGLAARRCLPGIRQGCRGVHDSQPNAMFTRARVPP